MTQSFARSLGADCVNGPSVSLLYSRRRARPPTTRPPPSGRALPCSVGSERRSQLGSTASLSNFKLPARPRSSERLTPVDRTSTVSLVSAKARWANCMFQPVAQTLASAPVPLDRALPWGGYPRYGSRDGHRVVHATGWFMHGRPRRKRPHLPRVGRFTGEWWSCLRASGVRPPWWPGQVQDEFAVVLVKPYLVGRVRGGRTGVARHCRNRRRRS